jgi:hypothetical protein
VQTVTPHLRLQDMEDTLTGMHALLKEMRAKAASGPKDPFIHSNLEMWELLVGHLDKQLLELRVATAAHDELEARSAAMYKQADDRAAASAQASRSARAGEMPTAATASSGALSNATAPVAATQAPAAQTVPASPTSSALSPN